ncbi:MAG TPA: ABC transporter substrate-binding protein [Dissulfurispiraceae bacterium]|nr:ABC transporter substrate-binding protein [Dissulfurispiraceae bacterium]
MLVVLVAACAAPQAPETQAPAAPPKPVLRVGITPDYPPIVFMTSVDYAGVEIDLAQLLAQELGANVEFVVRPWNRLMPSLMEDEFDIIMSGMSITRARKVRIDFTDYYMKGGLLAAIRLRDSQKYTSVDDIASHQPSVSIGVVEGTTGDAYVQRSFPKARRVALSKASDAVYDLKYGRIDFFIHDAPSIVWIVAENETDFTVLPELLSEEYMAWGIRRGNDLLRHRVNEILTKWKSDGTLNKVLAKWLPYYNPGTESLRYETPGTVKGSTPRRISPPSRK